MLALCDMFALYTLMTSGVRVGLCVCHPWTRLLGPGARGRFPFHSPPIGLGTPAVSLWGTADPCPRLPRLLFGFRSSPSLVSVGLGEARLFGWGAVVGTPAPRCLSEVAAREVGAHFGLGSSTCGSCSGRRLSARRSAPGPGFRAITVSSSVRASGP